MSDRDRSMSGSRFGSNRSNLGFSGLKSKQLVQSHIKSIMPSLQGGKQEHEIKYLKVRMQETLQAEKGMQAKMRPLLDEFCGEHYDYRTFKHTDEILKEDITEQDLFYIFLKEELASWGQKFSRQQLKESDGKKSIFIVQFLRKHKYQQKLQQRNKLIQKNRRDPMQKIIYYINSDGVYMDELQNFVMPEMDIKLKNKLLKQGDKVKTWALANKFKHKKPKRERLYIYIEEALMSKLATFYKKFKKKNGFKWTQIIRFNSFKDIMHSVKKREDELVQQVNLQSSISINPVSKIFDRSQSAIKSLSFLNPGTSTLSMSRSAKNIVQDKTQHKLRNVDQNFIIHSNDFEEADKIYQYVMSQKDNNWQRVVYEDKNYPQLDKLVKQIQQNEKQKDQDQYMRIINSKTLYIITYEGDVETQEVSNGLPNNFNNRYLLGYQNQNQLLNLLLNYARNEQNFTIVIIYQQGSIEDVYVQNFIQKNRNTTDFDNLLIKYKRYNDLNESLSMNSKMTLNDQRDVQKFLRAVMQDRDRHFDPFNCYANNYVYLLYRFDKQKLFDEEMRNKIGESARLKKTTYQDQNYLQTFLKSIQRSGDHALVLVDDGSLRQAQEVVKKFDKAQILNITDRKAVKNQVKLMAWGPREAIKQVIFNISEKLRVEERKQYAKVSNQIYAQNPISRRMPKNIDFRKGNNITLKISTQQTSPDSEVMQQNLNHHFQQQIRIQNYKKPDEIRLVNKYEEPLTFIICRDDEKQLNYMKSIAKQQKDDLRQQYILYTQNPQKYMKQLFNIPKYQRFRFISNSWKKIQQYIVGLYQQIRGIKSDQNDTIFQDELIHVMYYPEDAQIVTNFHSQNKNAKCYNNVRFHPISELQWVALEQSPHHVYYVIVNESQRSMQNQKKGATLEEAIAKIAEVQKVLEARKVASKNIQLLLINAKKMGIMRDKYIQGAFQDQNQVRNYIANTKIKPAKREIFKPHILIDKSTYDWYYFLNKNAYKNRYNFHYVENMQQAMNLIQKIRSTQFGAEFWYLANNQKDLNKFLQAGSHIEQGLRIHGIYHGTPAGAFPQNKVIFSHPQREQIQAFLINNHKRSQTIFSPESLRKGQVSLAMTKSTYKKVPIHTSELKKWKQDLGVDVVYMENLNELSRIQSEKNIFLISDAEEQKLFQKSGQIWPNNVWRIIFDSNERQRTKAHNLLKAYPNQRQTYYGHYPAEIRHYLRYLRYNLKNPPEKLKNVYRNQLTNIYIQNKLFLTPEQLSLLTKDNESIQQVFSVEKNIDSLQNSINYVNSLSQYDNLFILSKEAARTLQSLGNIKNINYIIYDQDFRNNGKQVTESKLITDERPQYITYLFNLLERRYDLAKNFTSKNPMRVMYMQNSSMENVAKELREIQKRNPNFNLIQYQNINDLKKISQNVVVLTDQNGYNRHISELLNKNNIKYLIIGRDKSKNLAANSVMNQYFIATNHTETSNFYNNLRRHSQRMGTKNFPTIFMPALAQNSQKLNISRPIAFKNGLDLVKIRVLPPFKPEVPIIPVTPPKIHYQQFNFIDQPPISTFQIPYHNLTPDQPMTPLNVKQFIKVKVNPRPIPLQLSLDFPPGIVQDKFKSKPDLNVTFPTNPIQRPRPKQIDKKLAIVHPDTKQHRQIYRVLKQNLQPKSFTKLQSFPYASDYDFENLSKNDKFMGFDRTAIFISPRMQKYTQNLSSIKRRMNNKIQFYPFDDNFDRYYSSFKQFLSPYLVNRQEIPYINRQDPKFWLSTSLYNVMVPLSKKKRYDSMKRNNIIILPYSSEDDIWNQLHRSDQFVIIVCQKKDYHNFKKIPRMSPRCMIVIEDSQQLKQDQVPLFRYPRKVLYYGPDAFNYLSKTRIPNKQLPFKSETMKVLFFNANSQQQREYVQMDDFDDFQKIPYQNAQDLFLQLIQKFKNSSNFKLPPNLLAKDLIKLHPKIYIQRQISYMNKYFTQYSSLDKIHQKQYKRSFKTIIKPQQYSHLPVREYDSPKQLRQYLEHEESPCLVYVDDNNREHIRLQKDLHTKHLFIFMFDLLDMWIDRNGYLIDSQKLGRQQLATKQALFTEMFNKDVFDTYNDMGYFYLSNTATFDKVRRIRFMTKEQLQALFYKQKNLLMIIFVEHTDREHIPSIFYQKNQFHEILKQDRVKLIFIHTAFVHNETILYVKYNEIDPVIIHINRVELASRTDFCVYPSNQAGRVLWHKFAQKFRGFKPKEYATMEMIDTVGQEIKGKFRKVCVICQKDQAEYIAKVFQNYSIRAKKNSEEQLFFWYISDADNKSFIAPFSNIKNSTFQPSVLYENQSQNNHLHHDFLSPNDISAKNSLKSGKNQISIEDVVEGKQFILNVNERMRESFPVGNLYASKVNYFRNISGIDTNSRQKQLVVSNQNFEEMKNLVQKNPNLFLVYVSNEMPSGKSGKCVVMKQTEISKFINDLQEIQRMGKNTENFNNNEQPLQKNLDDFKVIRVFYDQNADKDLKKQIFLASLKNKNLKPHLLKDMSELKQLMKQEGSLSLLLISKEPPNMDEQIKKQNYRVVKKKKARLLVPRNFNTNIHGLEVILEENENDYQNVDLNNDIDTYLTIMQNNPEKGRHLILGNNQSPLDDNTNNLQPEDSDKLNLHSNINFDNNTTDNANREWIKQRLDGGMIVLFADREHIDRVQEFKRKYNILVQEYSHAVNLNNNIRQKKDKFTLVLVDRQMLPQVKTIKEQYPKTVFVLANKQRKQIPEIYQQNISYEIAKIEELEPIIAEIYQENEKIKYNQNGKLNSKLDNKRTSYVDNGNSWRLSAGYNNTKSKNAFVFYKEEKNKGLINRIANLTHITLVGYKDVADAHKKLNTYGGYQTILIANDDEVPIFEDYVLKKKDQTYLIRFNPPEDHRENPKIKKNLLLSAYSEQQIANFLIQKFGEYTPIDKIEVRPREGKNYSPRYQPNTFGTTPRFTSQKDYVPFKNDPIYSTKGMKSLSRQSKFSRNQATMRQVSPKVSSNNYYMR